MSTYRAWDENDYPWPPPDGWYEGSDAKWWPEGYGPGPGTVIETAASAPAPAPAPAPEVAPPPSGGFAPPPADAGGFAPPPAGNVAPPAATAPPDGGFAPPPAAAPAPAAAGFGAPPASAPAPAVSQAYAASPSPAPSTSGGGGSTGKILAGVGGLIALLAVAVVGFLVFGGGDEDPESADDTSVPVATLAGDDDTSTTAGGATTTGGVGSFDEPYAIGDGVVLFYEDATTGEERRWLIEVLSPIQDITQAVADENQFNDPPADGEVFAAARVRVTYEAGPAPADVFDLNFGALGPSGRILKTFEATCGVTPDSLDAFAELFPGGSVEGNVCWATPSSDLPDMRMVLEAVGIDGQVYVRLN